MCAAASVFYVNLPIGAFTLYFIMRKMPEIVKPEKSYRLDYLGALLLVAAVVSLQLPLTWGGKTYAWSSAPVVTLLSVSGPLFILFFATQGRHPSPILPIQMFRIPDFSIACFAMFAMGAAMLAGAQRARETTTMQSRRRVACLRHCTMAVLFVSFLVLSCWAAAGLFETQCAS